MRRILFPLVYIAIMCISACQPAWNRANQGQLKEDMVTLFQRFECSGSFRSVQMVGTTRIGRIIVSISQDDIDSFTKGLELIPIEDQNGIPIIFLERIADLEEIGIAGATASDIKTSGLFGRHEHLRITDHSSFEYLILVYNIKQRIAFIEVEYAYG